MRIVLIPSVLAVRIFPSPLSHCQRHHIPGNKTGRCDVPLGEFLPSQVLSCQMLLPERCDPPGGIVPKKRIVINLDSTHAAHSPTFSAVAVRRCVLPVIMPGHVSSTAAAINPSADCANTCALDGVILYEPKFVGAVIRKIGPRTVAVSMTIR